MLADPIGDQASKFSGSVPGIVDDANAELLDLQDWLDDNGIDVEVAEQGKTALETLGRRVTEGSGELVSFTREALTTIIEGSIALILIDRAVGLHAALRRADRRGGALDRARAATGRRRTTTRRASSGRSSATSAASCCSR